VTEKSRELEKYCISQVMNTENGRAFMYRCLQDCGTFENIFNVDPVLHAHSAGKRSHGLWLISELKDAALDNYFKMLKENEE